MSRHVAPARCLGSDSRCADSTRRRPTGLAYHRLPVVCLGCGDPVALARWDVDRQGHLCMACDPMSGGAS